MRECATCRWFDRDGATEVDGYHFELGECLRPEGPLDPRTTRPQYLAVTSVDGYLAEAGVPVKCLTGLVSTGMVCRAFEARDPDAVTEITAEPSENPDLWGN